MRERLEQSLKRVNLDEGLKMSNDAFVDYLVTELNVFESEKDLRLFILESIGIAYNENRTPFPIKFKKNKKSGVE